MMDVRTVTCDERFHRGLEARKEHCGDRVCSGHMVGLRIARRRTHTDADAVPVGKRPSGDDVFGRSERPGGDGVFGCSGRPGGDGVFCRGGAADRAIERQRF